SDGNVSISSQVSDSFKVIEFVQGLAKYNILDINDLNIIAHDFGAYIALILCSKIHIINKLLLISPVIDVKKHVNADYFPKLLHYINRFLPGNVQGVENIDNFINMTNEELSREEFKLENIIKNLKIKEFKVINGSEDKVTPLNEINILKEKANIDPKIVLIENMDHDCTDDEEIEKLNLEIKNFFKKSS
ncbi:MAG: hypothetical protein ACTSQJ_17185, partial [Promethearchaeota archaeon]